MKGRCKEILNYLLDSYIPVNGNTLAKLFHITDRTLRNDISLINYDLKLIGAQIEADRRKGYWISTKNKMLIHQNIETFYGRNYEYFPEKKEERQFSEALILMMSDEHMSMNRLAELLVVSKGAIQKDIIDLKRRVVSWGLKMTVSKTQGHRILCDERMLRTLAVNILVTNIRDPRMCRSVLHLVYPDGDYDTMYHAITQKLQSILISYHKGVRNITIQSFVFVCLISWIRTQQNHTLSSNDNKLSSALIELRDSLTGIFELPQNEWENLEADFRIRIVEDINDSELAEADEIMTEFLHLLKDRYYVSVDEDTSPLRLLRAQIPVLFKQSKNFMHVDNPLMFDIISKEPFAYEMILSLKDVGYHRNVVLRHDDLSLLALQLTNLYNLHQPYRVALVSQYGRNVTSYIGEIVVKHFHDRDIEITNCYKYELLYRLSEEKMIPYDFIISTDNSIKSILAIADIPMIYVNPLIDKNDMETIATILQELDENRARSNWNKSISWLKSRLKFYSLNEIDDFPYKSDYLRHSTPLENQMLLMHTNETISKLQIYTLATPCLFWNQSIKVLICYSVDYKSKEDIFDMYSIITNTLRRISAEKLQKLTSEEALLLHYAEITPPYIGRENETI